MDGIALSEGSGDGWEAELEVELLDDPSFSEDRERGQ
jgi:hypothetical protein